MRKMVAIIAVSLQCLDATLELTKLDVQINTYLLISFSILLY